MYWDTIDSKVLNVSNIGGYIKHPHMSPTTPEGYHCDPLQHTSVLFMGSCDLDGPIDDTMKCWARLMHSETPEIAPEPYIALAKMTAGFMSFPKRLLTYCEKFGAPAVVYAVVPRPVAIEIPLSTGEIVSVSNRTMFAHWLHKHGKLNDQDYNSLMAASAFCESQINNFNYQLYQFEQTASFIKVICEKYGIQFRWTVNLSSAAIPYYHRYLIPFLQNMPFMRDTFVGVPTARDFSFDGSMGNDSQYSIQEVFNQHPAYDESSTRFLLDQNMKLAMKQTSAMQRAI